jgi:16S rRNA (uracil1498-N3)-methyltransferase
MHRFFVHDTGLSLQQTAMGSDIALPENVAHQVRDVLRLHIGEQLVLLDNSGEEFVAEVAQVERKLVEVRIVERRISSIESSVRITLHQGLLKSARFEWMLEKGTELGVAAFAPVLCHRTTSGLEDAGPAKQQRWQRIIQEATELSGRSVIPDLLPIRPLAQALADVPSSALGIIPWEEERERSLRTVLQAAKPQEKTVHLFIGPEGGFTVDEIQLAHRHGIQSVTLGKRIMRAETAALATVANVLYELE